MLMRVLLLAVIYALTACAHHDAGPPPTGGQQLTDLKPERSARASTTRSAGSSRTAGRNGQGVFAAIRSKTKPVGRPTGIARPFRG
jgi:hypothetical protein